MSKISYRLERIEISGIVQGVGFRPFVYNLANTHQLSGYVINDPAGVVIEAEGKPDNLDDFISSLRVNAPILSQIEKVRRKVLREGQQSRVHSNFEIRSSERTGIPDTLILPDVCVCIDCLRELFDPLNRRFLYPFINCTNCGPRFTIIQALPYDRPYTTMQNFSMCPDCQREYDDPSDRRFHAQPDACPVCGPQVKLLDNKGKMLPGNPVLTAIELLKNGKIVAIKGIGGFHLAVDAANDKAVKQLRERKGREEKPLALMVSGVESVRRLLNLSEYEERILTSRERPILLGRKRHDPSTGFQVADSVAPFNDYLGVMLPYTPLHYLFFFHPQAGGDYGNEKAVFAALVMTSGNISEESICKDNDQALDTLSDIADVFLVHNRDIHVRCDDSVVRTISEKLTIVRRSRGYAPLPLFMHTSLPQVLAVGGELKSSLCFTDKNHAFISQHIGDLENALALSFFKETVAHFRDILQLDPKILAYDLHPEYLSTKYCHKIRTELETMHERITAVGVQHHHAHIASVMAENGYTKPVIGFSMDGAGYGLDNTIWGGEVLLCVPETFERFAHLDYLPLPGGTAAIKEPWRMAFAYLRAAMENDWRSPDLICLQQVSPSDLELLDQACDSNLNSPMTSSLGRLFDAVASILDIQHYVSFEGQAAIMLETLAERGDSASILPYIIRKVPFERTRNYPLLQGDIPPTDSSMNISIDESCVLDYLPMIRALLDGFKRGRSQSDLAAAFHNTLLVSFLEIANRARDITGIDTVALSGGCWQNQILINRFCAFLKRDRFNVLVNHHLPANDGGLSLGQAFVAGSVARQYMRGN